MRVEIGGVVYDGAEVIRSRLEELEAEYAGEPFDDAARDEWNKLNAVIDEQEKRRTRLAELARSSRNLEPAVESSSPALREARNVGLRAIERHADVLRSEAADELDELVRKRDPHGLGGRYLDAVSNPDYFRAFGKMLGDPMMGHLRFTPEEVSAVRRVSGVEIERAMAEGTDSAGGFAIPFTLDPSILLSSAGAINPIRQAARVIQITTREWKGVSSAGVTASYDAEAAEVSDDSPTLAQPTITTAMGRAFVPFSMELQDDWNGLATELQRLIADARDVLDSAAFLTGTGTDEPSGVLDGLTTTQRVQTATTATVALADIYSLKQAVPARFQSGSVSMWHPNRLDTIYRFVGGNSTEPPLMATRDGQLLGKPTFEWSDIATASTSGTKIGLWGDFREGYVIADRLGMSAEIVPHLFGATARLPTGQRGLFVRWRSGGAVVVANALRYLEVL